MLHALLKQLWGRAREPLPVPPGTGATVAPAAALAQLAEGDTARRLGELSRAEAAYWAALRADPGTTEAWVGLGVCCYRTGRHERAHLYFRTALECAPNTADIYNELGLVDLALQNVTDARETFERAANADPAHPEAWSNLGLTAVAQGDLAQAYRCFAQAVELRPDFVMALFNLALACRDLNRPVEAAANYARARDLAPEHAGIRVGLALALQDLGELDRAREELESARARFPRDVDARVALGGLLTRLGEAGRAEALLDGVITEAPEEAEAHLALAHLRLAQGRFETAWEHYEWRLRSRASPRRSYAVPECRDGGRDMGCLLVYGEQGLGEQLMFGSMLPDLAREARVLLDCDPRLRPLFRRSMPQIEVLDDDGLSGLPGRRGHAAPDCCIAVGSLGGRFRNRHAAFPAHQGYLSAEPDRRRAWRARLDGMPAGRRIGVAWRGGLAVTGRAVRSLQVADLMPLLGAPNSVWVSLQHDAAADEFAQVTPASRLLDVGAGADLEEAAALICELDLVVSVCSTIVHLAGALGRPVWVLTPSAPGWRYMLEGESMPWYPSARLFRQRTGETWAPVIHRVRDALDA